MGGKGPAPMWAGCLSKQPAECVFWGLEVWQVKTTLNPSKLRLNCVFVVGQEASIPALTNSWIKRSK